MSELKDPSQFFDAYANAAWQKDAALMASLYDEDVVIYDLWNPGSYKGLSSWSAVVQEWLGSLGEDRVRVSFSDIVLHTSETVAFCSALVGFEAIGPDDAVLRGMKNRFSAGFVKRAGGWKVIQQHTSLPIDHELKAVFDI